MTSPPPFELSVFINCPFDEDYAPLLQAIAFCVTDLGLYPRIAPENSDNSANRLDRVLGLVRGSKYGIHDLSRCKANAAGEYSRLNMPFELGVDHACAQFGPPPLNSKKVLVLEKTRYDYQKSLSDIAGWDIQHHDGEFVKLVRIVVNWLSGQQEATLVGASRIQVNYATFQEWYWKRESDQGASEDDIKAYPTIRVLGAMIEWVKLGRPT
ncbi:hypothetical protein R5576_05320 [Xanthomonas euvesicatoria]|uniref:Uncharacterized protein n=1 Tax=Xanthomonas euvesicatoria TaxID=456327 RepID=A0AAX4FM62_XANEU|nr:hypothetical protein [Xanthomonas euvesicatoria]WOP47252.1 hypothetical protein R2B60_16065 [Xanthomonas euvesicatoria]WOP49297.1 hypothetical protein R2B60_06135 [Xanthomonas euvesicatoria]WOP51412.1 hypothetical protein R5576_15100 [Xanthomonas euvesicatoria]WOP53338.1 hypothetical protein R5576_05320 [Xanthomonas euvesicatoria]WOP55756.1 hypothetical protein R5577_16140 [Xanthomonas euvesicatoria]